jgi:hypothetical protein
MLDLSNELLKFVNAKASNLEAVLASGLPPIAAAFVDDTLTELLSAPWLRASPQTQNIGDNLLRHIIGELRIRHIEWCAYRRMGCRDEGAQGLRRRAWPVGDRLKLWPRLPQDWRERLILGDDMTGRTDFECESVACTCHCVRGRLPAGFGGNENGKQTDDRR